MQKTINTIVAIVVSVGIFFVFTQLQDCHAQTIQQTGSYTPPDTNFNPVVVKTYQEPLISLTKKGSGFKLPLNVREKDVKRVVSLKLRPLTGLSLQGGSGNIDIIQARDGRVYVAKDSIVESVTVTEFESPVANYIGAFGIGVSLGLENPSWAEIENPHLRWSPSLVFAPEEWYGWLHLPIATIDRYGLGAGAQARVYHDIFVGVTYNWLFTGGNSIKATTHFMF